MPAIGGGFSGFQYIILSTYSGLRSNWGNLFWDWRVDNPRFHVSPKNLFRQLDTESGWGGGDKMIMQF